MKRTIDNQLKLLTGLPLWNAGRTESLVWFDFGNEVSKVPTSNGKMALVAEYEIDTESAWHIRSRKSIIVGSADRFYAAGKDPYKGFEDTQWDDKPGENRCDERLERFIKQHRKSPLIGVSASANDWGGLVINLSKGFTIEVFRHDSVGGEYWRMFHSVNKRKKHFVVTPHGVEME